MKRYIMILAMVFSANSALASDTVKFNSPNDDAFHSEMRQHFSSIFNSFFNRAFDDPTTRHMGAFYPKAEMYETKDNIEIYFELAGIDKDKVELKIASGMVNVKYEDRLEKQRKDRDYVIAERSYGSFQRQMSLPAYADVAKAKAKHKDGILSITIPKLDQENIKPRKLDIN